ncbi:MAG: DNA polymerase III subunit epsilon [Bauldia sp.]
MREIVFDTETTGLDSVTDRIVEIGCVELFNHIPTGRIFHAYINPGRAISAEASRVHGLTEAFLADKPAFEAVAGDFLEFLGEAPLIAHNADFDIAFINASLGRAERALIARDRVIDSLLLARRKHPGGPNSLDGLCTRYGVDLSRRTLHGALLDASLLAEVYVELIGGRQANLGLSVTATQQSHGPAAMAAEQAIDIPTFALAASPDEQAAHRALVGTLAGEALWLRYFAAAGSAA